MGFQTWATPPAFIQWCEREVLPVYGFTKFGLDVCAQAQNAKAPNYIAPPGFVFFGVNGCVSTDGLSSSWADYGAAWCNPGFSECAQWLTKAKVEREQGVTSVVLTHLTTTAKWYHQAKKQADRWLVPQRINFLPPEGVKPSSNNRDSLLWVFSPRIDLPRIFEPKQWRAA